MHPEIKLKKPELFNEYENGKKEIFDEYAYTERVGKKFEGEQAVWIYSGRKYMPNKGQALLDHDPMNTGNTKTKPNPNLWDANIDAYWDKLVLIADELFAELNQLIHTMDYFKGGMSL
jgi:hypothetical protein